MKRLSVKQCAALFQDTVCNWNNDSVPRMGAAQAYYITLLLAPTMVIVLAIASLAAGAEAAQRRLIGQVEGLVGQEGAKAIQAMIDGAHTPSKEMIGSLLGLAALSFGGTSAVTELRDALNTIWRVPDGTQSSHTRSLFHILLQRVYSFAPAFMQAIEGAVSFVMIALLFAFKALPTVRLKWSDVCAGAVLTSLLFTLGKFFLGAYLIQAGFADNYGAAGSLVVLLVWIYYSAQVVLLGAEFTRAYTLGFVTLVVPPAVTPHSCFEGCVHP